jgi:hypothetical protein
MLHYILQVPMIWFVLQHKDHDERHLNAFGPSVSMLKGDTVGMFSSTRVSSWDGMSGYSTYEIIETQRMARESICVLTLASLNFSGRIDEFIRRRPHTTFTMRLLAGREGRAMRPPSSQTPPSICNLASK